MKKLKIIIPLIVLLAAISLSFIYYSNNLKEKDNTTKESTGLTGEEIDEAEALLNKLLKKKHYKLLSNDDPIFYNRYKSLEEIIYNHNVYNYRIPFNEKMYSVFKSLTDKDLERSKEIDGDLNGYVKRSLIDNQLQYLYNKKIVLVGEEEEFDEPQPLASGLFKMSDKFYYTVYLNKEDEDYYQIEYWDAYKSADCDYLYPVPIKVVAAKKINNYLLITSKAIYSFKDKEEDNKCLMSLYSNNYHLKSHRNKIGETIVDKGPYYSINIDDYLDNAGTIYTIFKKSGNDYYLYDNIINK